MPGLDECCWGKNTLFFLFECSTEIVAYDENKVTLFQMQVRLNLL